MMMYSNHSKRGGTRNSRANFAFVAIFLIVAFFLLSEHRAHALGLLPFALLLLCPLMHYFMHGGHGADQHSSHRHGERGDSATTGGDR